MNQLTHTPPPRNTRNAKVYAIQCYHDKNKREFTLHLNGRTPKGRDITLQPKFSLEDIGWLRSQIDSVERENPKLPDEDHDNLCGDNRFNPVGVIFILAMVVIVVGALTLLYSNI